MYISGTQFNFFQRMHQLLSSVEDFADYAAEGDSYLDDLPIQEQQKWILEARKKNFIFTQDASYWTVAASVLSDLIVDNSSGDIRVTQNGDTRTTSDGDIRTLSVSALIDNARITDTNDFRITDNLEIRTLIL